MLRHALGLDRVHPDDDEVAAAMPGDDLVPHADVVMDRAFTMGAPPDAVWPWLVQLGKGRAGWYMSRRVERVVPRGRRAVRRLDPRWQGLEVGSVIPDWGGSDATFTVAAIEPPHTLVHTSQRGRVRLSWAITLTALSGERTRVRLRLRLSPVRRPWLADSVGGLFDLVTIAWLAGGLEERVGSSDTHGR